MLETRDSKENNIDKKLEDTIEKLMNTNLNTT